MKALFIEPNGSIPEPWVVNVSPTGEAIERLMGGPCKIKRDSFLPYALIYTAKGGQKCRRWRDRWYYGNLLLIGWRNNRPMALSPALIRELKEKWRSVEVRS